MNNSLSEINHYLEPQIIVANKSAESVVLQTQKAPLRDHKGNIIGIASYCTIIDVVISKIIADKVI